MYIRITKLSGPRASLALISALLLSAAGCASAPPFQGMTASDLHALGRTEYEAGNYGDAVEALDHLLLLFPDYPQAAEARFLLAQAYVADEQFLEGADEYQRFLDRHRGHLLAPDAALGVCRARAELSPISQRDQTYTREAVTVCRNVTRDYEGDVATEAEAIANDLRAKLAQKEYENAEFYFNRGAFDSAILYWEILVDEFGDTEWAPRALLGIIRSYEEIGYQDLVEEYRQQLLNSYPDSEAANQLRVAGPVG